MERKINLAFKNPTKMSVIAFGFLIALSSFGVVTARQQCVCRKPCPRDCSDIPKSSHCGKYLLNPGKDNNVPTYCNMITDGGGWIVILRRWEERDRPQLDFNATWDQYKWGFGSFAGEFWWGLEHVKKLTSHLDRKYELRVDIVDFHDNHKYAVYQDFKISSEEDGYRLKIGSYSGNAGDSLRFHNGEPFSTKDHDTRKHPSYCPQTFDSGWWFTKCFMVLLTGVHGEAIYDRADGGIKWAGPNRQSPDGFGRYGPIKEAYMLVRPTAKESIFSSPFITK